MTYMVLLQYPVLLVLFLAQAMYTKHLFESFRRKVYMDILDHLILQSRKLRGDDDEEDDEDEDDSPRLRLVHNKLKRR